MRLIAAISTALFVVLAIGLYTNVIPRHRTRRTAEPQVSERQQWLIQAGLDLTPQQFVAASAAAGALAFSLLLLITGVATVSLAPAVLLAFVPRIYFGRARERRMDVLGGWWAGQGFGVRSRIMWSWLRGPRSKPWRSRRGA